MFICSETSTAVKEPSLFGIKCDVAAFPHLSKVFYTYPALLYKVSVILRLDGTVFPIDPVGATLAVAHQLMHQATVYHCHCEARRAVAISGWNVAARWTFLTDTGVSLWLIRNRHCISGDCHGLAPSQ